MIKNKNLTDIVQRSEILPSTTIKGKLRYLAVSMVILLLLYPFFEGGVSQTIIFNILLSAVCFFGVYAVSYKSKNLILALLFGLPWFISSWINLILTPPALILGLVSTISLMFFYTFTLSVILIFVLKATQVSEDVLFGAVSIYLLIGGIFNMIYLLIETSHPGSFFINPEYNLGGVIDGADFIYYSFATLTTLGYGDIVPLTSPARSFAVVEAIAGVMYLAIIISRLVGLYIVQCTKKS